jgi:SAM-dependent methyltransferase
VTALERDAGLLCALRQRAAGLAIETESGDARAFELRRRDFDLCVVAMHTIQLLGGAAARIGFLRHARAHLRPGGLLACAILTAAEPFDCRGGAGVWPDSAHVDGVLYLSRATRVEVRERTLLIERERRTAWRGRQSAERNVVELARLDAGQLEREALAADLIAEAPREVPSTRRHLGSTVVMLRA